MLGAPDATTTPALVSRQILAVGRRMVGAAARDGHDHRRRLGLQPVRERRDPRPRESELPPCAVYDLASFVGEAHYFRIWSFEGCRTPDRCGAPRRIALARSERMAAEAVAAHRDRAPAAASRRLFVVARE